MPVSLFVSAVTLGVFLWLGLHGLHRTLLLLRFRWRARPAEETTPLPTDSPVVTVQLPLFNERTVVRRLIQAVGALDWPADRLEIQVLDDSTDETRDAVDEEVARLVARGLDAKVLRRADRVGFKAGALDHGLRHARGDLVCIFDADFLPAADFLRRTLPAFEDERIGMVQARWEHVNRDESPLTRAQSALLDGHFVIEHKVRHDHGLFFNFNGTAGIWRRRAIEDAGGWQHDTLTEDLDLSYRAQLAGWRFRYLPMVCAPAEVPPTMTSFKTQQHRWAKGSLQVAKKLGPSILRARLPLAVKLEAAAHLLGYTGHPALLVFALLVPFSVGRGAFLDGFGSFAMFLLCTASVFTFYDRSQRAVGRGLRARLAEVPAAVALGIGLSVNQTRAVLEGLFGSTGEFVRTPKRGTRSADDRARTYLARPEALPGIELLLAAWFAWALTIALQAGSWGWVPFLILFLWGFSWVGVGSLRDYLHARGA